MIKIGGDVLEVITDHRSVLGEGPVWDYKQKKILWLDIIKGEIHECSFPGKLLKTLSLGQMVGAVAICRDGNLIAAVETGFALVNPNNGKIKMISNPESILGNRFNDGKCDPEGRFWAGTMSHSDEPEKGTLYMIDEFSNVHRKIESVSISNGLVWSADLKLFYFIDTPAREVAVFDYDNSSGHIYNRRTAFKILETDGYPDGMTIDTDGMVWVAIWDGWQVVRYNPLTGEKLLTIQLPVARVTSCTFGGENLNNLFITTARIGLSEKELEEQKLAGAVFVWPNSSYSGLHTFEYKIKFQ